MSIFSKVDFCMPIFLQYLLNSWFWLVLSNSFYISRHLTKFHPLKLTIRMWQASWYCKLVFKFAIPCKYLGVKLHYLSSSGIELHISISACLLVILFIFVKCGGPRRAVTRGNNQCYWKQLKPSGVARRPDWKAHVSEKYHQRMGGWGLFK